MYIRTLKGSRTNSKFPLLGYPSSDRLSKPADSLLLPLQASILLRFEVRGRLLCIQLFLSQICLDGLDFKFSFVRSESFEGLGWLVAGWKLLFTRYRTFTGYGSSISFEERLDGRWFNARGTSLVDSSFV